MGFNLSYMEPGELRHDLTVSRLTCHTRSTGAAKPNAKTRGVQALDINQGFGGFMNLSINKGETGYIKIDVERLVAIMKKYYIEI